MPNHAVKSVFYLLLEQLGVLSDQVSHLRNLLWGLMLCSRQQNATNCREKFNFSLRFRHWDERLLRVLIVNHGNEVQRPIRYQLELHALE